MDYSTEVIFQDLKEAITYYKSIGFILTEDKRIILSFETTVEIQLKKIGPKLYRSQVVISKKLPSLSPGAVESPTRELDVLVTT